MTEAPGAIPVTIPLALTIAAVGVADAKVKPVVPVIATPLASRAVAVSAVVPPIGTEGVADVTATVANACATTKFTLDVAVPLVAVIVAEPFPVEVAVAVVPEPTTLSTAALLDAKVTVGAASTVPLASFATAVIARVSPIETNEAVLAGVSVMVAATGVGGVLPESLLPHAVAPAAKRAKTTLRTARRMHAPIWLVVSAGEDDTCGDGGSSDFIPTRGTQVVRVGLCRLPLSRFRM